MRKTMIPILIGYALCCAITEPAVPHAQNVKAGIEKCLIISTNYPVIQDIKNKLTLLKDGIYAINKDTPLSERANLVEKLELIRSLLFSFYVEGASQRERAEQWQRNFATTSIQPTMAYEALVKYGIVKQEENVAALQTHTIEQRINKKIKEINDPQNPISKELRQLRYVFSNDVTRKNYDTYINNDPMYCLSLKDFQEIFTEFNTLKEELENKINTLRRAHSQQEKKNELEEEFELIDENAPAYVQQTPQQAGFWGNVASVASSTAGSVYQYFFPSSAAPEVNLKISVEQIAYAAKIENLMRKLNAIAQDKNQAFEEGTYVIEDPQGELFNFLEKFNDGKGNYTYHRISSHFPERLKQVQYNFGPIGVKLGSEGYGIDIPLDHEKNHILFNKFKLNNKQYIFIKPENFGTSWSHLLPHTKEYIESLHRKWMHPEANEGAKMRKEHTPEIIKKAWSDLIIATPSLGKEKKAALIKEGLTHGIYKMLELIHKNQNALGNQNNGNGNEFINLIKKMYSNDHLDIRKGNEVIITDQELQAEKNRPEVTIIPGSGSFAQAMQPLNVATEDEEPAATEPTIVRIVEEHFGK